MLCVKNECEDAFARRSANFTGPLVLAKEHAVRLPWTVTLCSPKANYCSFSLLLLFHHFVGYIQTYKVYL